MNVDVIVALVSAITGGGLVRLLEVWLSKQKNKAEQDKLFRDELRSEGDALRARIKELKEELEAREKEVDEYKEKYWKIYTEYSQFKITVYSILVKHGLSPEDIMPGLTQGGI